MDNEAASLNRLKALTYQCMQAHALLAAAVALAACALVASQETCPEVAPGIEAPTPKASPFDMLTADELESVHDYLLTVPALNITTPGGNTSDLYADTISYIELKPPVKAAALAYLDGSGPMPPKVARVVLVRSAHVCLHGAGSPVATYNVFRTIIEYRVWTMRCSRKLHQRRLGLADPRQQHHHQ